MFNTIYRLPDSRLHICQDDKNHARLRISFFGEDYHYLAEFFLNLDSDNWDHPELRNRMDWWHAARGRRIAVYFSQNSRYLSIDYDVFNDGHITSRTYELKELYDNATT